VPVAALSGFSIEPLEHFGESSTEADATTAAANALATTGLNKVSHIGSLSATRCD
jgi:hypothetical protein